MPPVSTEDSQRRVIVLQWCFYIVHTWNVNIEQMHLAVLGYHFAVGVPDCPV